MVRAYGEIPAEALGKAQTAYGSDIQHKIVWVVNKLQERDELHNAAESLQMDTKAAEAAVSALRNEGIRLWPGADIGKDLTDPRQY